MLTCNNLKKRYLNVKAVDGVTFSLDYGKIYAILGPNGSGKTTLMKMIAGLTKPNEGEIFFDGEAINVASKHHIAYMPTENYFYSYMTCKDLGKYYNDFFNDFSMDKYYELLNEMELNPAQKISKMSSGMMAKCKIAVTLARDSRIIMLDEPLNGIDIIARERIVNTIISCAGENKAILMSSHLVDELEKIVDNAIFMKSGKIILEGSAEELREQKGLSLVELYKQLYA